MKQQPIGTNTLIAVVGDDDSLAAENAKEQGRDGRPGKDHLISSTHKTPHLKQTRASNHSDW